MRRLIYAINLSLDGCCDHTRVAAPEDLLDDYTRLLRSVDLQVFGRKTYELMVPYWPDVARDPNETPGSVAFARAFCAVPRLVFSRTLNGVEDPGTRIARGDLREEIVKAKQQEGKGILTGGVDIPTQLVGMDLVDELRVVIQPTIAGAGRRLFDQLGLPQGLGLKLAESRSFPSGSVALRYLRH